MRIPRTSILGLPLLLALTLCSFVAPLQAEVRLAGIFGDHMVLQQGIQLPVWGVADPGEKITVAVAGQSASTTAGADGKWRVTLSPLKGDGSPTQMAVTGKNALILRDVLIGDVWLCSGQSNMEYSLGGDQSAPTELPQAGHPDLRLCRVSPKAARQPLADRSFEWSVCTPESAKGFSAVGYYFGRDIRQATGRPIGLICAAVSGTPAQSWISLDALKADADLKSYLALYDTMKRKAGPSLDAQAAAPGTPTSLFNGMISPVIPFGLKGVAWYQGESNTDRPELYRKLFPDLINDWRTHWHRADLPFVFVQLPGFQRHKPEPAPSSWAFLREAQAQALSLPNTGMAVTLDLSRPRNILHPRNKREVGRRLALVACHVAYGQSADCYGPVFQSTEIEGDKVRVTFQHTDGGLMAGVAVPADLNQPVAVPGLRVKGFSIAGTDRRFVWADAVIDGDAVIVSSDKVKSPVAVRYGWDDNPEVNLYNKEGLPAAPFRTDGWEMDAPRASE